MSVGQGRSSGGRTDGQMIVPVRHYGRMAFGVTVIAFVVLVGVALARNPNIDWGFVRQYLLNKSILKGLVVTLEISVLSIVIGTILAVVVAVMRMSPSRIISGFAFAYTFFFRALPMIVLLIFVGNLGLFLKHIAIGIPGTDISLVDSPTSQVITPFVASVVGLSLVASAYMSEIVRAGLLSVGQGQLQAAKALGMKPMQILQLVTLPQAWRVIMPPLGNEFINTLKASALVSVIAGGDLLTVAQSLSGVTYKTIEMLIVASIWYLLVIVVLSVGQHFIERRVAEK